MPGNTWVSMKQEFRREMEKRGLWHEAIKFREKLKITGTPERQAWEAMMKEFWPKQAPTPPEPSHIVVGDADGPPEPADNWMFTGVSQFDVPNQDAQIREIIEWVAANIIVTDVDVEAAPGTKALGLLRWVKQSPMNESDFWKTIYPKVMPTKKQLDDEQERLNDDGDDLADHCEELARLADGL